MCLSYTHDRDYGVFKRYPLGKEKFGLRAWCPPEHAQYDGWTDVDVESIVARASTTAAAASVGDGDGNEGEGEAAQGDQGVGPSPTSTTVAVHDEDE